MNGGFDKQYIKISGRDINPLPDYQQN